MVDAIALGVPIDRLARYFEYWLLRLQGVYEADPRLSDGSLFDTEINDVEITNGRVTEIERRVYRLAP